jgi:hypothetical protein
MCHNYETNLPKGTKKPLLKAPFQPQNSLINKCSSVPPSKCMMLSVIRTSGQAAAAAAAAGQAAESGNRTRR